jgi:hypothetical protein
VLFIIILATLPFYCAGILLWGTAQQDNIGRRATSTITPTLPPNGTRAPTLTPFPSVTPFAGVATTVSPLVPTPGQSFPIGPQPTRFLSPTPFVQPTIFIPTFTPAPTLTPLPTDAPPQEPTKEDLPPIPTFEEPPIDEPPIDEPPIDDLPIDEPLPFDGGSQPQVIDEPQVTEIAQ